MSREWAGSRLVDEFSAFARMPNPIFLDTNLVEVCKRSFILQKNAHPEISFHYVFNQDDLYVSIGLIADRFQAFIEIAFMIIAWNDDTH